MGMVYIPAHAATTPTSVDLRWTAVGDDSLSGTATTYDIRYSTSLITAANFAGATPWSGVKTPAPVGTLETLTITGLTPSTTYWFAIKVADEVPNWSAISNVVSKTTLAPPDTTRPAPIITLEAP
jgi:chitodextrinase